MKEIQLLKQTQNENKHCQFQTTLNESLYLRSTNHGNTIRIQRAILDLIRCRSDLSGKVINLSQ